VLLDPLGRTQEAGDGFLAPGSLFLGSPGRVTEARRG
jgi:hypothetical protein